MSDFIPVLVVAVLLLSALIIGFGAIISPSESAYQEPTSPLYYYSDEITLGQNFTVSNLNQSHILTTIRGNITSGIVSNIDQTAYFDVRGLDELEYGRIRLNILDTNTYGRMFITINGNVIYDEATYPGTRDVMFNKNFLNRTGNIINVRAEGSGWRIWAPTIYILDMAVMGEIDDDSIKTVKFDVDYIPDTARIRLFIDEKQGSGNIIISINNYRVYRGYVNTFKTFDPDVMIIGENTAVIEAEPNSKYKVEAAYIVFE